MGTLPLYLSVVRACCCVGAALIALPALALDGTSAGRRPFDAGSAAFVSAWIAVAVLVPSLVALRGFNWVTALLVCAIIPSALWLWRHRVETRRAFTLTVRQVVLRSVSTRAADVRMRRIAVQTGCVILAAATLLLASFSTELRLAAAADFDTLSHTRALLNGSISWDPIAALAAMTAHVAAVDALVAVIAVRLTMMAAAVCVAAVAGERLSGLRAGAVAAAAPFAISTTTTTMSIEIWALGLLTLIAIDPAVRWLRRDEREPSSDWSALAAVLLVSAHLATGGTPARMWRQGRQTVAIEHTAAARETVRLGRDAAGDEWRLVAPPEQAMEIGGHVLDLAAFVSRYARQAGRADFRFELPAKRLYVMVEKQTLDVSRPIVGVRFITSQPAVYRVQRERERLERAATRLCDEYLRTHARASIAYDDVALRIYQFEL